MRSGAAAQGVTAAIVNCIDGEAGRQDRRLNAVYQALMRRLPQARRVRLRSEQRSWIRRRDSSCYAEATAEGDDSYSDSVASECALRETVLRRVALERYR